MQRKPPTLPEPTSSSSSSSAVGLGAILVPQLGAWSAASRVAHEVQPASSKPYQQQPYSPAPLTPSAAQHGTAADTVDSVTIDIHGVSTSSDGNENPATSSVLTDVQEAEIRRQCEQVHQTPAGGTSSTLSSTTGALTAATATAATETETATSLSSTTAEAEAGVAAATVVPQHVDLLCEKTDVYACAVRGLLHCKRSTALHMWSAMIIISFVQLTLLAQLLRAAQTGTTTVQMSDNDLLALQSSIMQLQICQMHQAIVASNLPVPGAPLISKYGRCEFLINAVTTKSDKYSSPGMWLPDIQRAYANLSELEVTPGPSIDDLTEKLRIPKFAEITTHQQLKVLLVMLLSMGALSVLVIRGAVQAMQLAYAVAASASVLPIQFTSPEHRGNVVAAFAQRWRVVLAYPIPLLQMAVAVLAFWTAGSILSTREFLDDITHFIINSVALAFVIEIGDKAGDVLAWVLRFKKNTVLLDEQYSTCAAIGFNTCSVINSQPETGVTQDLKSLCTYTGRSFAWAILQAPLVLLVAALVFMPQYYSYIIYRDMVPPNDVASTSFGHCLERLIMLLLFVVLLMDQPLIIPQHDDWLDVLVDNRAVNTLVGARSYMWLCSQCARFTWVWYLLCTCAQSIILSALQYQDYSKVAPDEARSIVTAGVSNDMTLLWTIAYNTIFTLTFCCSALWSHWVVWCYDRVVWHTFDKFEENWISTWHVWSTSFQANSPSSIWWKMLLIVTSPLLFVVLTGQLCIGLIMALLSILAEIFAGIPGPLHLLVRTFRNAPACCAE